ncbi:MAG: GNVR domain-containing protein, partial [Rikenellaceae bacterium]
MKEYMYDDIKEEQEESIDFMAILFRYLANWYWFVLSLVICVAGVWLYLRYTTPIYNASTSILIKDEGKGGGASSAQGMDLESLGIFSGASNFDNEIEILKSRTIIEKAVTELDLYISYFDKGQIRDVDIYNQSPVKVWMLPSEAETLPSSALITMSKSGDNSVAIELTIGETVHNKSITKFPSLINTPEGTFSFNVTDSIRFNGWAADQTINAVVSSPISVANGYKGNFTVSPNSKTTTIATLSIETVDRARGVDFLNKIVEIYNRDANDDKNEVATKTAEFIGERIAIINKELGTTEEELEAFKRDAGITDLKSDAQIALTANSEYQQKSVENSTQLRLVQFLRDYANKEENLYEVLPINVGLVDAGLSNLIVTYNEMLLERKRLLRTSSEDNPAVVNLDGTIVAMRNSVRTTIESVEQGLKITERDLKSEADRFTSRITNAPTQERQLVSISRQQEIKAGLYLMLLQKREENALTLASTANNARIFDRAYAPAIPISPNKRTILMVAILLGLAIPVVFMYIRDLFRFKIEDRKDVEKITSLPIVGDIPRLKNMPQGNSIVVHENSNDIMAESFRDMRTNIMYMLGKDEKVVLVTSTSLGEGKSFVSTNLAISMALMGKKVIVVGLDIRKPGLNKTVGVTSKAEGISNFLANPEMDIMSLIYQSETFSNLSYLFGGAIPPNPTELLTRDSLPQAI